MTRVWALEETGHESLVTGGPIVRLHGIGTTSDYPVLVVEQRTATVWLDPVRDAVIVREPDRPEVVVAMRDIVVAESRFPFVSEYESTIARRWRIARALAHEAWLRDGYRTPEREERAA